MTVPSEPSLGIPHPLDLRDLFRRVRQLERRSGQIRLEFRSLVEGSRLQAGTAQELAREQAGLSRDLEHLQHRLEALNKVLNVGNGERALTTRLAVMEAEFEDLKEAVEAQSRGHWKLLASLSAGLLSLLSSVVLWLLKGGS